MPFGIVEPAGAVVRAAEVHVRRVVVAEPAEDGLVVLDALAIAAPQPLVAEKPLAHEVRVVVGLEGLDGVNGSMPPMPDMVLVGAAGLQPDEGEILDEMLTDYTDYVKAGFRDEAVDADVPYQYEVRAEYRGPDGKAIHSRGVNHCETRHPAAIGIGT